MPTSDLSLAEYDALLRNDFSTFVERSFTELNPGTEFARNWHLHVMAYELQRCLLGETRRLIINLPPRSLKSHCASIAFPAWIMGHNPSAQIICASYAQDLADKHAIDCRALINSSLYRRIFPATCLSSEKRAIADFLTTARGCRKATSVGGVLTGRGADFIIIDDPLQPDKALSDARRNSTNDWYDNTLISRLNHKLTGCIVIVMQRLHEDDLVGHVLAIQERMGLDIEPKWNVISFPAIAEQDEHYEVMCLGKPIPYDRRAGEVLHPEREPREILDQLRETLGEYHFAGQYQQSPAPLGGGIIKANWFRYYTDRPEHFDFIFQSWDTANKASELNDYSVCTTWGVLSSPRPSVSSDGDNGAGGDSRGPHGPGVGSWGGGSGGSSSGDGSRGSSSGRPNRCLYLLDCLRRRMEYPELKRTVLAHAREWTPRNILIEDRASGTQLIQELRQEGLSTLTRCDSKEEKIVRMSTASNMIENGQVYLPEKAPWLSQYVHELVTFPNGKYYDQADSTSQALIWFKSRAFLSGIQQYYKEEAMISNYRRGLIKKEDVPEHLWKRLDEPPPPPRRGPFGPCW